jgi:hypothetical protein
MKKHDVKFIIYQALYIFVVCVVAMKHANLDLTPVMVQKEDIISEDSLRKLFDVIKTLRFVDTNIYVIIDRKVLEENEKLAELYKNQPPIPDLSGMIRLQPGQRITTLSEETERILEKIKPEELKETQTIRLGKINLYQYYDNTLNNPYNQDLEIVGVTSIPPKSSKTFRVMGQTEVVVKVGDASQTVSTIPNQKPKVTMTRIAAMGEDTRVSTLNSTVGFRVSITDDHPDQLQVKFGGPITVRTVKANETYDVTLNFLRSKAEFETYTNGKSSPYSVGFTVTVTDPVANHTIPAQNVFVFGDW